MKIKNLLLLTSFVVTGAMTASAQIIWDAEHLAKVKEQKEQPVYNTAYKQLIKDADKLLNQENLSVMMKEKVAASGDKHDYLSQARYYWPDPTKPDGKPYIRRDGESNPELNKLDRNRLGDMASHVTTLSLAYYLSNDEKYAKKATEQLRVWFLDKKTKMNPNLNYAQMVPGLDGERGRSLGVLDAYSFVEMLDGVQLLEGSNAFTEKDSKKLKAWFSVLLNWILTNEQAKKEEEAKNNHGTAYDVQVIAYANYVGNREVAKKYTEDFLAKRIDKQIEDDGKQPLELARTLAFGYSQYNLTHIVDVFLMAKHTGMEVGGNSKEAFKKVEKAFDFLAPYLGKDVKEWPYKQLSEWEAKQQALAKDLYRVWLLNPERKDYFQLYHKYAEQDWKDRYTLLYVESNCSDNAYASAAQQLEYAISLADSMRALKLIKNKRPLVSPRCTEKDGSLRMVHQRDWCSGFFPGNLWQMYMYTHDEKWREAADRYTWSIEGMKDCKDTHDLGFVVYDSFGKAYEATGDTLYRNVIIQAAKSLASRYSDNVKAIRSWDHHKELWNYPVIIDNMLNLELLFEATKITGDSTYYNIAVNHANTTLKNHFRDDYSCYHVVSYNPETGEVEKKCTHQGIADMSVWSRGHGWAIYGYTLAYRYTHNQAYLDQARKVAKFWFSQPDMPEDLIPYWDMRDPAIKTGVGPAEDGTVPRDASAAAVIASGLYELATYVSCDEAKTYRKYADTMMDNLYKNYRSKLKENQGFLLLHSTGNYPANDEIDKPIVYADYYYLEALARRNGCK